MLIIYLASLLNSSIGSNDFFGGVFGIFHNIYLKYVDIYITWGTDSKGSHDELKL